MKKILLVEDEKNFGLLLRDYLRMHELDVTWAENGEDGFSAFQNDRFDLCILDIMMPKKDGFTLSAEIRALNADVPLVFLTARGMKEDMMKGYRHGADDYIVKPFDSDLLLMKINAMLQRRNKLQQADNRRFSIGQLHFDSELRTLSGKDGSAKLSPKEAALLKLLCEHSNGVLPRDKALKLVWKDNNYFTGRSMDVYIVKLRKYLAPHAEISNVHGDGYSLKLL